MKLAFMKGTGIVDRVIQLYTFSRYSHCELIFSDGTWFGSSPQYDFKTGFRKREELGKYWDFIEVNVTSEEEDKIRKFCESNVGHSYDWKGIILSQIFPFGKEHPDKWFCSEICVAALQEIGRLQGIKPHRVSPGKLYKLLK